ncbi:hypothetical protein FRACYDRAFT_254177 [Fragilariopsis cylindrus CCMP1102]|uniref:Uncharacterized protein n=1 Tax=Fragilariopsis cylindrus CCMP1102 TaxID=635003 RepID=A0A1E7EL64_9STRA|nr:hypothetical protein FRACYDRAFT_254177 [Fragilariopsis cylindrus CCMP1102]|eukprot:OEU06626.1 hypothetical protein FRACYDRAFT_254177 [Fragilariopsis cylindrus CCMP1102]
MATTSTSSSSSSSRKALSISDLWTMNEPTLVATNEESNSNNKRFHLTYEVNDMIEDTMFTTTFWATTDCSSGESPLSEEGLGYRFITTNDGALSGDGSNVRSFHVVFEITDEISVRDNPDLYTIDDNDNDNENENENGNNNNSRIVVCVRSSLNTMNGKEVNYVESIIQFRYVYENGFSVANDITVTARDNDAADTVIDDERSIVDAYDCTDDPIGNTKNIKGEGKGKGQGTLLRLCVQPKPNALISGFRMKAIENYRYETKVVNEEGSGGGEEEEEQQQLVQYAVEDRVQTEKNDLTRLTCIRGQGQCVIETLLNAAFYSQQREVYGKGTVTYQLGQEDGGTGNTNNSNANTASDNGNSGNSNDGDNGRRLRRGLKAAADDGIDDNSRFEQVEWEIIDVIFVVEKDDSDYDDNKKIEGEGRLKISRYNHSNNASIVIIILIVSNLMAGIVHFVDYRQQHKVVEHRKKLYEH